MICVSTLTKYCSEDISLIENYEKAIKDKNETWHCHHKNEILLNKTPQQLKKENLYYYRPANELILLLPEEHMKLHHLGKNKPKTDEHKHKISLTVKKLWEDENYRANMKEKHQQFWTNNKEKMNNFIYNMKGKQHSEETRKKMSKSLKGKNTWTKGTHRVYDNEEHTKWHMEH